MAQKVNPTGFRIGIYKDWDARWFAPKRTYGALAIEDIKIRNYLEKRLENAEISHLEIEKAGDNVRIIVHSARPGYVIGKKGQEIDQLRSELAKRLGKNNVEISIQEIKQPELNASLISKNIAKQLERRVSYKKAMKRAIASAMRAGAQGIKIAVAGRLGGAEIARTEWLRQGSLPLHTLRADIQYGFSQALTTYGIIGVKVWLSLGEYKHAE